MNPIVSADSIDNKRDMENPPKDKYVANGSTLDMIDDDVLYQHQVRESRRQEPHHRSRDGNVTNNNLSLVDGNEKQGVMPIQSDTDRMNDIPQTESNIITNVNENDLLYKQQAQEVHRRQPPHRSSNGNEVMAIQGDTKRMTAIREKESNDNHHKKLNVSKETNHFNRQNFNILVERRGGPSNDPVERNDTSGTNPTTTESLENVDHDVRELMAGNNNNNINSQDFMIPIATEVVVNDDSTEKKSIRNNVPLIIDATPIRRNKKTIMIMISIGFIIFVVIVTLAIYFGITNNNNDDGNVTNNDNTSIVEVSEAASPWFQLGGDLGSTYPMNKTGAIMAVSRNGSSIAIGMPGSDKKNYKESQVFIYRLNYSTWEKVAMLNESYRHDLTGQSIAMDEPGSTVVVGSPYVNFLNETNVTRHPGTVRIYMIDMTINNTDSDDWADKNRLIQIGQNLTGYGDEDEFGWSVDISNDGKRIVVGSRISCYVKSFEYSSSADKWIEYGQQLNCTGVYEDKTDTFLNVELSGDGNTLLVAEAGSGYDADCGIDKPKGQVMIYRFDGTTWQQLGQSMIGNRCGEQFGGSISLSDNGQIIALCSPQSNGGNTTNLAEDTKLGSCAIYSYNNVSNLWEQLGDSISGNEWLDNFGSSVSLNANGSIVAIGAPGGDINFGDSGYVRILEYNDTNQSWISIGKDIVGPYGYAEAGHGVAISGNGDRVTIAAPNTRRKNQAVGGTVFVYERGVVMVQGQINITLAVNTYDCPSGMSWFMDRLDIPLQERAYVIGDNNGYPCPVETTKMTTTMVPYGLYRIRSDLYNSLVEVYVDGQVLYNLNDKPQQVTFIADSPTDYTSKIDDLNDQYDTSITLSIDFDERPSDIHWVVVLYENVTDKYNDAKEVQPRRRQSIVAYGPQNLYGSEWMNTNYNETINIVYHSKDTSEIVLIVTDDGRDGLCCDNGNGMIRLYNHNQSNVILENNMGEDTSRFVHRLSMNELL